MELVSKGTIIGSGIIRVTDVGEVLELKYIR